MHARILRIKAAGRRGNTSVDELPAAVLDLEQARGSKNVMSRRSLFERLSQNCPSANLKHALGIQLCEARMTWQDANMSTLIRLDDPEV